MLRPRLGRTAFAAALSLLAGAALAGPAVAAPATATLQYHCHFPLMEPQPVTLHLSTDLPTSVAAGTPVPALRIRSTADVPAAATRGLVAVGSTTLEGTATAGATVRAPGVDLDVSVPNTIAPTQLPDSGPFSVQADGQTPALTFPQPGSAEISVRDLLLTLTPRLADGTATGLDTFETECTQDPGQDGLLGRIEVTGGGSVSYGYTLAGSSQLKTLTTGAVPLSGSIDAQLELATGAVTADLALDKTKANLVALWLLPVTADIEFVPVGQTTGSLSGGRLTTRSKLTIKLPSITLFGFIPIGGGATCQTKTPSDVTLTSGATRFDPLQGGTLTGTYAISDLQGCGSLNGLVSPLTAGSGNTITLKLTPTHKPGSDPFRCSDVSADGPGEAPLQRNGSDPGCGRSVALAPAGDDSFYTPPSPLPAGNPGDVIRARPANAGPPAARRLADAWQVMYRSTSATGEPMAVTGTVLVPKGVDPATAPIVGFGPGTTGPAFRCTVSRFIDDGAFYEQPAIDGMLRAGYAVAITDYEGYHPDPDTTYIVGRSMGAALIDAVRAATRLPDAGLSAGAKVAFRGYSQGGGAAMWAGQMATAYAPDLHLVGVVGGGVPSDLIQVALGLDGSKNFGFLLDALIGLGHAYPELDLDSYLNAAGRSTIAAMEADDCTIELLLDHQNGHATDLMTTPPFLTPTWLPRIQANALGGAPIDVPVFQYHGTDDHIVAYQQAADLRRKYCALGMDVQWKTFPLDHITLVARGNADALSFLADRFAGRPPTSNCDTT